MSTTGKIKFEGASQYKAELAKMSAANKALAAEMQAVKSGFDSATTSEQKHEAIAKQLAKQIKAQSDYVQKLTEKLKAMSEANLSSTTEYYKTEEALHKAQAAMNQMQGELDGLGKEEEKAADSALELSAALDVISDASEAMMDCLKACVDSAVAFESAMAAVSRTTGVTGPALEELGDAFKNMSTTMPTSTSDLAAIATTAGQLGIASDNVLGFTETIAQLSVVAGMSAEDVATSMAQIANITRDSDYSALADTIAVMGDATATTANRILDMSLNLAAAATNAGMSTSELIALSAAISSTGVQAQAGGTAMSRLIQQINMASATGDKLDEFAKVCEMSSAEFKAAWENDSAATLMDFIAGLDAMQQSGQSLDSTLSDLGISSQRELVVVKNLAGNSELLANAVGMANEAYAEGGGLAEKFGVMAGTTEAQLTMAANAADNFKIAVGDSLTPIIGGAADAFSTLIGPVTEFVTESPQLVAAFTTIVTGAVGLTTASAAVTVFKTAIGALGGSTVLGPLAAIGAALGVIGYIAADVHEAYSGGWVEEGQDVEYYEQNVAKLRTELEAAQRNYDQLAASGGELSDAQFELNAATVRLADGEKQLAEAQAQATAAAEEQAAAEQAEVDYLSSVEGQLDITINKMTELATAYGEAYQAAETSLGGQFKLFQQAGEVASISTEDMIAALNSQADYFNKYADNLNKLEGMTNSVGLAEGLVDSLNNGSAEAVQAAQSLVEGYQTALAGGEAEAQAYIDSVNAAYENQQTAMSQAAAAMADSQTEFSDAWSELASAADEGVAQLDKSSEAYTSGTNTIQGLLNGIEAMAPSVIERMRRLGEDAKNAYDDALNMGSPSKEMRQRGKWTVEGLVLGINDKASSAVNAMSDMAQTMVKGYDNVAASGQSGIGNTVNIYPQQLDDATIDYVYNRFNNRLGGGI